VPIVPNALERFLLGRLDLLPGLLLDYAAALGPTGRSAVGRAGQCRGRPDRPSHDRTGDFFEVDLGTGFDVVLIANIVHGLSSADAERLVRRGADAARPGGLVIVADQVPGKAGGPATAAITALLGLGYLVALGGQTWPPDTISGWLRGAGLESIRHIRARRAPGNIAVVGKRV